jgi:Ricin-type beta-trefoil lectin domain-like
MVVMTSALRVLSSCWFLVWTCQQTSTTALAAAAFLAEEPLPATHWTTRPVLVSSRPKKAVARATQQVPAPAPTVVPASSLPWEETFAGLPNGTTSDVGSTAWTLTRTTGKFDVQNEALVVNGAGAVGVFTTPPIRISGGGRAAVSVQVRSRGPLETNGDYVRLFVNVDNGPAQLVGQVNGRTPNATTTTLSGNYTAASTIVVVIHAYVTFVDEFYIIDNIKVMTTTGAPGPIPVPVPIAPPVVVKAPTKSPTRAPVKAATKAPIVAPVRPPTIAPVRPPTKTPTGAPATAPVRPPTKATTSSPTTAPVRPPTKAPTRAPTTAPVRPPAKAPTRAPTTAPVRPPTKAPTKTPTMAPILPPAPVSTSGCAAFSLLSAYHIIASHSGMAVAVDGDAAGANVEQRPATSALNDNWSLVPTWNGYYHVMAQHSGYALSALGRQHGANVAQRLASQSTIDDWCFVPVGNNYYEVRNRFSGLSLDVASFSFQAGGNVQIWSYGGGANQQFSLVVAGNALPIPTVLTPAWLVPVETPVVAAAAANLPDGRVLMWSSSERAYFGLDPSIATWTAIYNPTTGE